MISALRRNPKRRKYILAGTGFYLFLLIFLQVLWPFMTTIIPPYNGSLSYSLYLGILIAPSFLSAFTISYWSKDPLDGLYGVLCSGIVIFALLLGILLYFTALVIVTPVAYTSEFGPPFFFLLLIYFISFSFFIPIAITSAVLAFISSKIGYRLGVKSSYEERISNHRDYQ
ncbi:MAG: hypothetical protein ACXADA_03620 [Candidatus Hodarchaeales archaeon]